ncbi:MAG TPA: hypothetical protein ENN21_01910 [Spirochaetes bacterium]|nr:hypothetical protein [Spirochaetota bacterium]
MNIAIPSAALVYLKYAGLVGFGLLLGFLSAIPVGAVQLEVAKKAVNGHLMPAVATAVGSACSDFLYGFLTLFGLGQFLFKQDFQIFIYSLGIAVIVFLFYRTFKEYRHTLQPEEAPPIYKKRFAFLTGFTIAATNPGIIIWWIIGFKIFHDLSLFTEFFPAIKFLFILSGCAGLGGYLIFLALILHRMHHNLPDKYLDWMHLVLLGLFVVLTLYFSYKLYLNIFDFHGVKASLI